MSFKYIFGPVSSRRFGQSLGIDLSPNTKQCNFNCLYCELSKKRAISEMSEIAPVDEILNEIKKGLKEFNGVEVLTITANGEPTLYPYFSKLINSIKKLNISPKLLILSNASKIAENFDDLLKFDIVKFSLDAACEEIFKKIDNPKKVQISKIIENIIKFRQKFTGILVIEILVVSDINDSEDEFKNLAKALRDIKADRVDIGTIDRPPAFDCKAVSLERLNELAEILKKENIKNVEIIAKPAYSGIKLHIDKDEILATIKRRPQSETDISQMFDEFSLQNLRELLDERKILLKNGFFILN